MPAYDSSPQISKTTARRAIERIPEVRNGSVEMSTSVAGYCNDSSSTNYGKVWALLTTRDGPLQYSGYANEGLRRTRAPSSFSSENVDDILSQKSAEGFKDIESNTLQMKSWWDAPEAVYRGRKKMRKPCALMTPKDCKSAKRRCTYRKGGSLTKTGKVRKSSCAKKSRRRTTSKRPMSSSSSATSKGRTGAKRPRRPLALSKSACEAKDGVEWIAGKKGSRVGYCRRLKRSLRKASSKKKKTGTSVKKKLRVKSTKKKLRRITHCNTVSSTGKKRTRRGCKQTKGCSWRKGSRNRKGSCRKE